MVIRMNTKGLHKKKTLGMAKNLNAENFHLVCRLCLVKTSMKLNIFHGEGIKRRLFEKILNCLSLIVSEDDKLSKVICHSCVDKLESFQDFRDMCHESENILNAFIASAGGETLKTRKEPKSSSVKISKKKHKDDDDDMEAETALVEETLKSLKEEEGEDEGSLEEDAAHDEELDLMMQDESYDDLSEEDESSGKSYEGEDSGDVEGRTIEGDNEESSEGFPYPLLQGNSQTMSRDQTLKSSVNVASSESVPACDVQINVGDVDSSTSAELGTHDQLDRRKLDGFHTVEQCGRSLIKTNLSAVDDFDVTSPLVEEVSEFVVMDHPYSRIGEEQNQSESSIQPELYDFNISEVESLLGPAAQQTRIPIRVISETYRYDGEERISKQPSNDSKVEINLLDSFRDNSEDNEHGNIETTNMFVNVKSAYLDPSTSRTIVKFEVGNEKITADRRKKYMCLKCGRFFKRRTHLKLHLNVHSGSKPYTCRFCNNKFAQKTTLNNHLRVHTGEKPYSCKHCNQKFSVKGSLNRHVLAHNNRQPFVCRVCGKGYSRKENLNKHANLHFML